MSYNAKNHFEQGGERFVVGGELAFEEGAGVTGFPSDASFITVDLNGLDMTQMTESGIDITEYCPVESFRRALTGEKPLLIKNAAALESNVSALTSFSDGRSIVTAVCGLPNEDGSMNTILLITLCLVDDKVIILADSNERLSELINGEGGGFTPAQAQEASTASTVAALKDDFNALLEKLKIAGIMTMEDPG